MDPLGDVPLQCDEGQRACVDVDGIAPAITRDATLTAVVGLPYRYNAEARIRALGSRPVTFGVCGGPPELHVDPRTGDVAWIPAAAGAVPLCLNASNTSGSDSYSFTVTVAASATGAAPVANLSATPLEGSAPLDVAYDGSASTVDPSTTLVGNLWEFGDGSPWRTGLTASTRFFLPGGVYSTLTVFDGMGREGTARAGIRARNVAGRLPPLASITASAVRGTDSLDVDFSCNCQPGDGAISSYQWDFGDGTATGATVRHTFAPGRYHVRLTVMDQFGLTGSDVVEVTVTQGSQEPPRCRTFALPPAGLAPLNVRHRLVFGDDDGTVTSAVLTFPDGTSTTEVDSERAYATAGAFPARLLVTDDSNLTCADQVQVVAVSNAGGPTPPRFLSSASRAATCGVEWRYSEGGPQISGDGPYEWWLLPAAGGALPEGMTLDPSTGQVTWLPTSAQVGEHRAILRVRGAGGTSDQLIDVVVACGPPVVYSAGCCSSSGPGVAWMPIGFFVMLWLYRAGRRRHT
jgi:PKD repeat protein